MRNTSQTYEPNPENVRIDEFSHSFKKEYRSWLGLPASAPALFAMILTTEDEFERYQKRFYAITESGFRLEIIR